MSPLILVLTYLRNFPGLISSFRRDLFFPFKFFPRPLECEVQAFFYLITYRVPWKGTVPQRVRIPPGKLSLQPVAIGADDGGNDIVRSTSVERVA